MDNKVIGINAIGSSDKVDNVGYAIPIQRFLIYKNTLTSDKKIRHKPKLEIIFQVLKKINLKNLVFQVFKKK